MPYKLLLADDSVTIQRVIELTFADEDVAVTAVGDGQQAIDRIRAERPDIVLADVGMPKQDGYEVAAFIKNDPSLERIPVLLLTGAFEPVDDDRARLVRCDGVLAKPFEPQLLISRVRELLRGVTPSPAGSEDASPAVEADAPVARAIADPGAGSRPIVPMSDTHLVEADEDATVRMPRPSAPVVEDDPPLDVEALGFSGGPAPAPDASLDDYFDRLDAAFAHLTGAQAGREGAAPPRAPVGDPWAAVARAVPGWPATPAVAAGDEADAGLDPDRPRPEVSGPGPELGASSSPGDDLDVAAPAVALPDAFAALLDAEREHGAGVVHQGAARAAAAVVLPGTAVTPAFIDEVARRVFERLGEPAFRDVVAHAVSATAERLVREEIERIKATIR